MEGSVVRVTLSLIGPGILTVFAAAFSAAWLIDRKRHYLLLLSGSCSLFVIGVVAQVVYWPRDTGLNAMLSGAFYTCAVMLAVQGILLRSSRSIGGGFAVSVTLSIMALLWYFFYVDRSLIARIYIQNFGYGAILIFAAGKLLRSRTARSVDKILFWTLLLFGAQFFPRTMFTIGFSEPISPSAFADTVFWQALQLSLAVLGAALALAILSASVIDIISDLKNERDRDHLTNLLNRRGFEAAISDISLGTTSHALILCDVDWFKSINDEYGHDMGDAVLKLIASVLQKTARKHDIVGRLGGEEFAVDLADATLVEAHDCAERFRKAIRSADFSNILGSRRLTASFGVAVGSGEWVSMYKTADTRLYDAKKKGRDQTVSVDHASSHISGADQ
ncbi:GGDEF domain-containing protein [Agrobacterium cavarae]|uniref:GGDEF domain-containing protein n=1 Tax=Agrobacterium cavarae TaxID=2528239 RepID=UPI0028A286E0|nr:GGDEF domain-containing protein [Agrobacterium cavarae]